MVIRSRPRNQVDVQDMLLSEVTRTEVYRVQQGWVNSRGLLQRQFEIHACDHQQHARFSYMILFATLHVALTGRKLTRKTRITEQCTTPNIVSWELTIATLLIRRDLIVLYSDEKEGNASIKSTIWEAYAC